VLQHTGLDDAQLGPRLARLLAPSSPLPAREMVARGLAPLAGAEPWLALYQLWVRGGATLADQASRTASDLPVAAVMTALVDPHLPAVVLDFIARRRIHSPETLRLVVHHPRVHDATLRLLARCAPEGVCGAVARNQRRWLACPAIAEQLLRNPCCDRATAHAVLELGAREAVSGLAELRSQTLAGAVLQDSPEAHARAIAWMLRSGPADPFLELGAQATPRRAAPGEPEGQGLPGLPGPARGLSLRPGPPAPPPDLPASTGPSAPPIGLTLRRVPGSAGAARPTPDLSLRPGPAAPSDLSPRTGPTPPDLSPRTGPQPSHLSPRTGPPASDLSPRTGPTPPPIGLTLRPSPGSAGTARPSPDLSLRPDLAPDLSPRTGPGKQLDLTLRPASGLEDQPGETAAAPARPRGLSFQAAHPPDELDELDLPIADDWDELDPAEIPPPAPRGPVLTPARPPAAYRALAEPQPPAPPPARPTPRRPTAPCSYAERLELVLDPGTPLPLAMSQLHRLRAPDLRRVAAARRLPPALVAAARRRVGAG
jgi:hypothetical protein